MKTFLLIFIVLLTILTGCKQNLLVTSDLQDNELKGPVKSCKVATYIAIDVNGKIVQGDFSKSFSSSEGKFTRLHFRYDGKIDTISYLDERGSCVKSIRFYYNDVKLKTYEITANFYGSRISYDSTSYTYNSDSKLIKEEWVIGNEYHGIRRSSYDINQHLIADSTFNPPWRLINRNVWKNNAKGNIIENAFYWEYDKLYSRTYRDYDNKNRKIFEAIYYPDDNELDGRYVKYEYNSLNKVKLEQRYTKDKKLWGKSELSFNKNGDEEKTITYDLEANTNSFGMYKYEYDTKGNWIKKIFYYEAKPSSIVAREISYY